MGGAVVGGGLGAVLGNALDCQGCALIGGLVGAAIGGYTGNQIGQRMDQQDAARTQSAVNSRPTGSVTSWSNPDTGMQYDVTPTRTYKSPTTGDYCREVTIGQAEVGGQRKEVYGTACRQPDGSWKMQQ
jgi:surface antigen